MRQIDMQRGENNLPEDLQVSAFRRDADQGREPQLVPARQGTRMYSLAALQERIESEFIEEYGAESPALREADTPTKRIKLVLETVNYVLGVESVVIDAEAKADLIERIHSNLFGYGVLDPYLTDERVTTIDIHGAAHVSVRYGHGELERTDVMFEDEDQLRTIVSRLLRDAGAQASDDAPIIETGLVVAGRPLSLSMAAPPISPYVHVDIRLHPAQAPTLDDLVADGFMFEEAAALVRQIVRSGYGFTIVGESESGKTTLLNALVQLLPPGQVIAVERAGELRLPEGMTRLTPRWSVDGASGTTFGQQIESALVERPDVLILDEIRSDEPLMILPLLANDDPPRQIWTVRGVPDAKRLQSSMGMLARRADMSRSEDMVMALYDRLPFVLTVHNIQGKLKLFSIAEWQSRVDSDYPDYVMLMQYHDGGSRPTGKTLARWLDA
ncbi:MAG: Flp pilus assembly complex ATPase component TadA [Anaerolineae bacterium]|nr:Flp pilus assembly complex ATPase component TadA [Anaerolineae bacterium]